MIVAILFSSLVCLQSNITLYINYETGQLSRLEMGTYMEKAADKLTQNFRQHQVQYGS